MIQSSRRHHPRYQGDRPGQIPSGRHQGWIRKRNGLHPTDQSACIFTLEAKVNVGRGILAGMLGSDSLIVFNKKPPVCVSLSTPLSK